MRFQVLTDARTFYTSPYFDLNLMKDCGVRKVTELLTIRGNSVIFLRYKSVNRLKIKSSNVTDCVPIEIIR
jgi:hypothetical protein